MNKLKDIMADESFMTRKSAVQAAYYHWMSFSNRKQYFLMIYQIKGGWWTYMLQARKCHE